MADSFSYDDASATAFTYEDAGGTALKPSEPGFIPTIKRTGGQMLTTAATATEDVTGPNAVTNAVRETGQGIIDRNPAGIKSLRDLVDSPWLAVKESVGQFAPQIGAAAAGGFAGARAGGAIAGPAGAVVGGAVGSLLPIFTQEYGGIRQEQKESGQEDKARALAAAIPATALERVGMGKALSVLKGGPVGAGSILKEVGKGVLKEGATEGAQNVIEQWGAFKDPTAGKNLEDTALAAAMGGIGGGVMGGATGAVSSYRQRAQQQADAQARQNAEAAAASAEALTQEAMQPPTMDTIAGESINPVDRGAPATFEDLVTPAPTPEPDPYTAWDQQAARPSEAMGLDPAAGPLSRIAVQAVDSGAYMPPAGQALAPAPEPDPVVLQNRDRTSAASIAQMQEIAANPDYLRVGPSRDMTSGAPVVFGELPPTALLGRPETVVDGHGQRMGTQYAVVDAGDLIASNNADGTTVAEYATGAPGKLRSVAGNGRTAGLQAAYQMGTAQRYRQELAGDAAALGVDAQALATMQRPVLVRVMQGADVTRDMGDRTNITATQKLSPLEQAGNDARRLDVGTLAFDEGGNPTPDAIKGFVSAMPVAERGDMLNPDGTPTRQAVDRLMAATFKQAYESDELVQLYAQATDPDARAVMAAAADASGVLANLKGTGEFDVRGAVADAAKMAVNAARQGLKLSDVLQNQDLDMSPEAYPVAAYLAQHIRTPKKMAEGLRRWGQLALEQARIAEENTHQGSLLGPRPTLSRPEIFARLGSETNPTGQGIAPAAPAPQPAPEQAALVPPAQATPAAERHPTWRQNAIQAGRVARALGLEPKGKRLAQIVAEVDAVDAQQTGAAQDGADLSSGPIDQEWSAFAPETGTLGIARAQMPQIKAEHRGALVNFLKARGIDSAAGEVPANDLKPTQAEFAPGKVKKAREFQGPERSILVSSDGHVVDGHHQWLAKRAAGEPVKVIRLKAPIRDVLAQVAEFPSTRMAEGAARATPAQAATDSGADAQGAGAMFSRAVPGSQDFVPAPDGGLDYGEITPEMGKAMRRQAGVIRLQQGVQNPDGTGWGLAHIEARHGKEIRTAGFDSVEKFVADAFENMGAIWKPGVSTQLIAVQSGRTGKVAFIQLEADSQGGADFYRINSAFPAKEKYVARKEKNEGWVQLWSRYPVPADASGASGFVGQSPKAGETAPTVSDQSGRTSVAPKDDAANYARADEPMSPDLARAILALGSPPKQATKESVRAAVRELVNGLGLLPNRLGRIVVATSAEIKQDWEPLIGPTGMEASGDAGRAQGFYDPKSKTVFLIADNILQGDELGVVAHELMHKHGPAVLGEEGWNRLHGALGGWAKAKLGSMERIVYDEAARRVRASGPELSTQELFPYAVQVALEMGVRPNAVAPQGTVERWLGQVRAALRTVWEKITRKPELFKSQDLVNLAFGIAQRENPEHAGELDGAVGAAKDNLLKPNDPMFSRAAPADRVGDAIKSTTITDLKKQAAFKAADLRHLGLQFLGRRQLVDVYGDMLPELRRYSDLMARMDADKNEAGAGADQLATDWAKLPDEHALAELMHDSTLAQIDPSKEFVDGDNKADWTRLRAKHQALSPAAKEVYARARDTYRQHMRDVRSAIKERIERAEMSSERRAALLKRMDEEFFGHIKGVYFPLARFGQYVVVVKGADGKVANVSRAETMAEADTTRRQLLAAFPTDKGFTVGKVLKAKEFVAERDTVGRGFMEQLYGVLDKQGMEAKQRAELEDALGQLYLSSLPDLSWAKHGIHRKGTAGFSQDARRAFAQNVFHGASYLAKLRYSDRLQDELSQMQRRVDESANSPGFDQPKAQDVVSEMVKRHESAMNPKSSALSTGLTSLGFMFHLGLSPASAMVNLTQTVLVAYPIMGARWGFGKSSAALLKASHEAARGKNDITGSLSADEKAAYDEAVRSGVIDVTMAHDLAGIAQGEDQNVSYKLRPVMRAASFMFHHAEKFNRQVTFVAAYRLARETGADNKAAYTQAVQATYDGHFDYSSNNRPRVMQGNAARVLLLFKQYGQNMVYTLVRNAQQSLKGATPQERAQARKALGGLLTMHGMAAGALGLPMVTTLLAAASMLGGDDDEPWDAQVALQNMLADTFGQKPAEVLSHGLSRLTPWDISGRVGLDKLILPDIQEGLEGQRLGESAMAAALGPVAGIVVNLFKGVEEMGEGRYVRGLETMMPTALRSPLKALRYGTEGVRDKSGIVVQDEVDAAELLGQAAGFSPSSVRNSFEGKSAIVAHDRALQARRSSLVEQFAMAAMAGDEEGKADARTDIAKFNEKNPNRRILPMQLAQSVRMRTKRIEQAQDGVYLPAKRRDAMDVGRFATGE